MTGKRLSGTTIECLEDFFTKNPHLQAIELLAEFCDVNLAIVQRWQRGEYTPGGLQLLRTRYFLALAGYEVAEWNVLPAAKRHVAMIVAFGLMTPLEVATTLGFRGKHPVDSLWRITLTNGGYVLKVEERITELQGKYRRRLTELQKHWRSRTAELLIAPELVSIVAPVMPSGVLIEDVVIAFTKMVAATAGLGHSLEREAAGEHLRNATGGGQHLLELAALLTRLANGQVEQE